MKALIIEDDKKIAAFLESGFEAAGFNTQVFHDGEAGLEAAIIYEFDIAIIDLMLPRLDGLSVISEMRAEKVVTPVIILSARSSVPDRISGLEAGADDYVTKPFSFSELLARVQAVLRRSGKTNEIEGELRAADLVLDCWKRELRRGDDIIVLHAREFALLELLMRNPGRLVSKTAILENVYGYDFDPQSGVVDVLVHRLRKKLDDGSNRKYIQNQRGMGYVFDKK
jgi:two-component system OmpR family response regulator